MPILKPVNWQVVSGGILHLEPTRLSKPRQFANLLASHDAGHEFWGAFHSWALWCSGDLRLPCCWPAGGEAWLAG